MSWLPDPRPEATCLVTGASSGIGAAIARKLAARGHGVTLLARGEQRLQAIADEIRREHPVHVETLACDLADPHRRGALGERLTALDLDVDVLVNCAGFGAYGRFVELDRERELDQARVACEALLDLCGQFAPAMTDRRSGAILVVSSSLGFYPLPGYASYSAAKAFAIVFGQALHAELRSSGVAVTTLCPGPVPTGFFSANGDQPIQAVLPRILWTEPDAVAHSALAALERNRRIAVPGVPMRALTAAGRHMPSSIALKVGDRLLLAAGARG